MTTVAHNTERFNDIAMQVAQRARAVYPAEQGRITRGLHIVWSGGVDLLPDGMAHVASQSHPGAYYTVNGRCQCPDERVAPARHCKHRWAKTLYKAALKELARHPGPERWYATYTAPDTTRHGGIAEFDATRGCWLFTPEDGSEPLYPAMQAVSLGGHVGTAETQRELDGDLVRKVCFGHNGASTK